MNNRYRSTVALLHGANSSGDWYPTITAVLKPHFLCAPLEYDRYRSFGKLKLVQYRGGLIVVAVSLLLATGTLTLVNQPRFALVFIVAGALGLYSSVQERRRRQATFEEVSTKLRECRQSDGPLNVIAHSFGTHLAGETLRTFSDFRPDQVILTGSILPRDFDWDGLFTRQDVPPFRHVRNEIGGKDTVVWLVKWGWWLIGRCGASGRAGFLEDRHALHVHVHTVHHPLQQCGDCTNPDHVVVHNVWLKEYGHSTHYQSNKHGGELWLPALWGYEPIRFLEFRKLCSQAVELKNRGELDESRRVVDQALRQKWPWTTDASGSHTLEGFLSRRITKKLGPRVADLPLGPITDDAAWMMVEFFDEAARHDAPPEDAEYLYPPYSARLAIEYVTKHWTS